MIEIRSVRPSDVEELVAIYAPYVEETVITFETQVPTATEFADRIEKILEKFPYLVAEEEGRILGYAYASTYYPRAAYDWTVELSIYISQKARGQGIGNLLYSHLEKELIARGFKNFLACISLPNPASLALHEKMGYKQVAHLKKVGYKFGNWHDIVWLQKSLVED
ncbi:GNAT family N-acetyltransferase [Streptococcus ruminantium]|uniref:N-acetyltransferase family protein n=1 Tax=Streptococcus ruminantium TaxID=1917441 RepID=A0ABU1B2Q5_9STRE|nr:GNAT family N-acetyltransferase [Streptococcus ruminantium]MDQ8758529.1 N-acetyltransferase family protein [Streptococcus ruminantium]MDQ8765057.1 N-acetyltransferase family protein [Streptococcus ruminantium]MDQ8767283.1 N-acetyltransferase family protein [Streptococcus ruminantium]MDQ8768110.1 N-acetyltransferase family protein [Streptococcus ruminantium]MDQ8773993.1 N-acetyltransferase family protein [Streptococcus ruminantium]